jgi:hypothetical protein
MNKMNKMNNMSEWLVKNMVFFSDLNSSKILILRSKSVIAFTFIIQIRYNHLYHQDLCIVKLAEEPKVYILCTICYMES